MTKQFHCRRVIDITNQQFRIKMRTLFFFLLASIALASCSTTYKTANKSGAPTESGSSAQFRKNIVVYAKKYVGSPYKYSGGSPSGFDCSGFTSYVMDKFGIKLSPASAEQAKQGAKIALDRVRPGDLIIFGDNKHIQHVALVVEHKKDNIICIHSTTSRGVIIESVTESTYWKPRILYARDVIGK